jgi:4'-phosphopantetheinyl transferase
MEPERYEQFASTGRAVLALAAMIAPGLQPDVPCHEAGLRARPALLSLLPGQVDVWVALVDQACEAERASRYEQVLTQEERLQRAKFVFEKDRRRYLVTRAMVRYVLSRYLPIRPQDWRFEATYFGRPCIINAHPGVAGLTFNISHSDQVVLLGVTRDAQLGIDVEDLQRNVPIDVADIFFAPGEIRQLRALPPALQAARFLDFWTLKESYIKARGKGLSLPLDQFGFELGVEPQLQVNFEPALNDAPHNWTFWQWRPSADSIAALCAESRPGIGHRIKVRRTIPFVMEQDMSFDVVRESSR